MNRQIILNKIYWYLRHDQYKKVCQQIRNKGPIGSFGIACPGGLTGLTGYIGNHSRSYFLKGYEYSMYQIVPIEYMSLKKLHTENKESNIENKESNNQKNIKKQHKYENRQKQIQNKKIKKY